MKTSQWFGDSDWSIFRVGSAVTVWYLVDFTMNYLNLAILLVHSGDLHFGRITISDIIGDSGDWGFLVGRWFSVCLPLAIVASFVVIRKNLTLKSALTVSFTIVVAQWACSTAAHVSHHHTLALPPDLLFIYLARIWTVLPGPILASLAAKVSRDGRYLEA